ncbi:hypothetical protein F0P96_06225 [Hymenobacter busanensis]|uniref:Uncharacterized protein n=1 Tax=Hymenobacter busanensis TaxID=2607656 RepID=A0A7L5A1J0_9BACT|nr:hypothetical protein [Hymenobacter busanensis]KAA9338426.1 hypothetical protein F0P96_06225 [Hymenobacter busanensis]QHJ09147.1 hypothetical protein GUY19_18380 [Hymenobacter busanensis]
MTAADPDAGQNVQLQSDVTSLLPGATFQTSFPAPSARVTWQVPANAPFGSTYSFGIALTDDACPSRGTAVYTIPLRVGALVASAQNRRNVAQLSAYPTPFTNRVRFQLAGSLAQPVVITDGQGREVARLLSQPDGAVEWTPRGLVLCPQRRRTANRPATAPIG